MLDCVDHQIKEGRIPSSLLEVYVRYKKDTRAVIAWLVSHGTQKYQRLQTLSIRDLFGLSEIAQVKAVELPEIIQYQFREAIAARTQLSDHFRAVDRQNDVETTNHEYFTQSLTKIYTDLCECCARPNALCKRADRNHISHVGCDKFSNPFVFLDVDEAGQGNDLADDLEIDGLNGIPSDREANTTASTPRLIDDTLEEVFGLWKDIQEATDILSATANTWEQAAQGQTSLAVAAFVTHAAFAAFEEIEQRLKTTGDIANLHTLRDKVLGLRRNVSPPTTNEEHSCSSSLNLIDGLQQAWRLLLEMKHDGPAKHHEKTSCKDGLPTTICLRKGSDSTSADKDCLTTMLQNIGHHIQHSCRCCRIVRVGTPILAEVGFFLTKTDSTENGFRCSYGLRLLLEAYRGYLFAPGLTRALSGCRLQILRFTQEVNLCITAVLDDSTMPCRCHNTLAYHLQVLQTDLQAYLTTKGFDFYFQSPWVAGSHTLEILEALFYYGMRLLSYRNYVGAVVHVYNVLRRFTGFAPIAVLEHLCNTFGQVIFPGGRPERNIKSSYIRYMGGRLRFGQRRSTHTSGCHLLAIPPHTAQATAGFGTQEDPRFDCRKISIFYQLKKNGYYLDNAAWCRIFERSGAQHGSSPPKTKRCSHHGALGQNPTLCDPRIRFQELQQAISRDFDGAFPVAKINFCKVYLAIVRVISLISDRSHGDQARPGQKCLCFTDVILSAADRYGAHDDAPLPFGHRDLVTICQDAMVEVLGGMKAEDCLWEGI